MKKRSAGHHWKYYIAALLFSALVTAGVIYLAVSTRFYLNGRSVHGQLYKLEMASRALSDGSWYPLYAGEWYNGYEIFRCTSPLPYVFAAFLTKLCGSVDMGMAAFYGSMAFLVMWGFLQMGIRWKRMAASGMIGIAYLLTAPALYAVVCEGSLDIVAGMAVIPWLLCEALDFLEHQNRKSLIAFSVLMLALTGSHYILALTAGLVFFVYLCLRIAIRRTWRYEAALAGNLIITYVLMAYFLYPAVTGGLFTRVYSVIGEWKLETGYALLAVAVTGLLMAEKKRVAAFVTVILAVGISYEVFEPVLRLLPSESLQKPYWYLIIGTAAGMAVLVTWKRLRMGILVVFLGIMVAEGSLMLSGQEKKDAAADAAIVENYLIGEAVNLTDNRMAVIDDGMLGDVVPYYTAMHGVSSMYGWDVENGLTTRNQLNLAEAFTDGFYEYMFGAALLYGNDVVVIIKELLPEKVTYEQLCLAAENRGYTAAAENDKAIVFKAEQVSSTYGVIATYENLAIGEYAHSIAYIYPSFGVGHSDCLEDYTVEELAAYKRLYLSGFTYREKTKAESLLREVANKGVKIYIDMQHIPQNKLTGKNEFMDIYAQFIQFTEDFPVLSTNNGNQFKLSFYTTTDTTWNTVYVSGCTEVLKEAAYEKKKHLTYLGRGRDENITFMGFNLAFYYLAAQNRDLKCFLDETFEIYEEALPQMELVLLEVESHAGQLRVTSPRDNVNSNIAAVETLVPDRIISKQEQMWVLNEQETVFAIKRPDSAEGLFIGAIGLTALLLLWIVVYVALEPDKKKNSQTVHTTEGST